jgi:sugar/nucleoside kinase (ribokinase family)
VRPPNSVSEKAMAARLDLVAVGNAVIDHTHRVSVLPRRDEGVFILDRRSGPGGVEANVITAAARLGLRTGLIARIGSDPDGMMILDDLKQRDVDVTRVQVGCEDATAYTFVFVDGRGDRIMMTGGRGVRDLTLSEADDELIRRARVCFSSGYLPWPLLQRLAGICSSPGGPLLAFDLPGRFEDLSVRGFEPEHLDALLPSIDLFMADRESLRSYTGAEEPDEGLRRLQSRGVRRAAVSDGERGVTLLEASSTNVELRDVPAFQIPVVDTTGAGDVLHAALIVEWLIRGQSAARACRFACAAAALSCQGWGVRAALPSRAEVEALLANAERDE